MLHPETDFLISKLEQALRDLLDYQAAKTPDDRGVEGLIRFLESAVRDGRGPESYRVETLR